MGINATIINDTHLAGWLGCAVRWGELTMKSARNMVENVLTHVLVTKATFHPKSRTWTSAKLSCLTIVDHGAAVEGYGEVVGAMDMGQDEIDIFTFPRHRAQFERLAGHFDSDGYVHIGSCHVGVDVKLLGMFADAFGVPVVAGRSYDNSILPHNLGQYVRVYPQKAYEPRQAPETFFWRLSAGPGVQVPYEPDRPKRAIGVRHMRPQ